jgi:Haem-binding domain
MLSKKLAAMTALVAVAAALVTAQFVPAKRVNPRAEGTLVAPPKIEATLRRACYDCHSNETRWPWYSRVAPFSWFIVRDVNLGRKEINFSEWGSYYPRTRRRKLEWMGRALHEEEMPPWSYRLMHPGSRLTEADRAGLLRWIESALNTPSAQTSNK